MYRIASVNVLIFLSILSTTVHAGFDAREAGHAPAHGQLPLHFVANAGQLPESTAFSAQTGRHSLLIGKGTVTWVQAVDGAGPDTTIELRFMGAASHVSVEGRSPLPGVAHFYRGNDLTKWVQDVPTYRAVAQRDLYPGITQLYRATANQLKSEFLVEPGSDPSWIRMAYTNAESLMIDEKGALVVGTPSGAWRESAPIVYQEIDGRRIAVEARFRMLANREVGFALGSYDPSHLVVIDPTLSFSTYLGGTGGDGGGGIAVDSNDNVLVIGTTSSVDFPTVNAHQATKAGPANSNDMFVAKLDPTGENLVYATYLGGEAREFGTQIAVDSDGNAYSTGWTTSLTFPTTPGVLGPAPFGVGGTVDDAAVFKLSPTGTLLYATYLGGAGDDQVFDIAVDAAGHAYVTGTTSSFNYPATAGAFQVMNAGIWDVFLTKLDLTASVPIYSTLLGGAQYEESLGLAIDANGDAYVVGRTQSNDFPIEGAVYDPVYDGTDTAFLSKVNNTGTQLVYSTFLDGISPRFGSQKLDVAVDQDLYAYVAAPSEGSGFPAVPPSVFDDSFNGAIDAVVMKVTPDGSDLVYSTFLGGSGEDRPNGITVDDQGVVTLTGYTSSSDFPLMDSLSPALSGPLDVFLAQLGPAGETLPFSTFFGGTAVDTATDLAVGSSRICLTGATTSTDFPIAASGSAAPFQPTHGGGATDAWVACFAPPLDALEIPTVSSLGLLLLCALFAFAAIRLLQSRHLTHTR